MNGRDDDAWTTEEAATFMRLAQEELSLAEIAAEMGRSEAEIKAWSEREKARGLLPEFGRNETGEQGDDGPGSGA